MLDVKTKLLKFCELGWSALFKLKVLARNIPELQEKELWSNPALQIAEVTNSVGQTVAFAAVQQALILPPLMLNPDATDVEKIYASASIEGALMAKAARDGFSHMLFVVPENMSSMPDEKWVRVLERRVTPELLTANGSPSEDSPIATRFRN